MLKGIRNLIFLPASLIIIAAAGCAKQPAPPVSVMDTPEYHYNNGLRYLEDNRIDEAMRSFDRATALDPRSPLGHIGKGLALGKKGDFRAAFRSMDRAGDHDKGIESRIGMIRLYTMQMVAEAGRSTGLLKDAEDVFLSARGKEPDNAPLHYYMALAYKTGLEFDKSADLLRKVLDLNREFTVEADAELAVIQKVQRAAPGTETGKAIALIDKIDRADVAALFDKELDLEKLFTKRGPRSIDTAFRAPEETTTRFSPDQAVTMAPATDIGDHWLKSSIDRVIALQVRGLEPGPGRAFEPEKLITKGEFALMLEDILVKVSGDEKLATRYIGATSPFPDVRSDHYAFNAIMTVTSRGFLEADKATGVFNPTAPVSGAGALLAIREIKNQLKF